ncbi:hypothetical protein BBJ28_00014675 [Nothophytophthora sp. Chile5]|nr:hypothetical protein BBJ28_00014675 [Nothophytophthora sp. Chile5]
MRLSGSSAADLGLAGHPDQQQEKQQPEEEELFVSDDGQIFVASVDDKSRLEKLQLVLDRRERELRQAAEYGLGLLEANEELQMQVATLKIQLETETEELTVERDTYQRRLEHTQQEVAQWKRKFARVDEEKTDLADEFEQFVDRCECRGLAAPSADGGRRYSHHLDTIAQLQAELQELQANERASATELLALRQWKQAAEHQQEEAHESEVLAAQSELAYTKQMEDERATLKAAMEKMKGEKGALLATGREQSDVLRAVRKRLQVAEEERDESHMESNTLTEQLLSSESRCKRLQRELELLEHVSYFSEAVMDRDDEESDDDDEIIDEKPSNTEVMPNVARADEIEASARATPPMLSPLSIKRRRSIIVTTATPYSAFPTTTIAEDGTRVKVSESEMETHKKLHHYFHLTAQSIIHENNLHERCFSSSSRLTIDMWYREIIAKDVPFLEWHSWLINRISEEAATVQDGDDVPQPPASSGFGGAFHGFSLRKARGSSGGTASNQFRNAVPSPPTASSSPASSPSRPVTRVPFSVARAFFRLLRKSTNAGADTSPPGGSPTGR